MEKGSLHERERNISRHAVGVAVLTSLLLSACGVLSGGNSAPQLRGDLIFAGQFSADGTSHIYDLQLPSKKLTDLTPQLTGANNPQISPDNAQITFYADGVHDATQVYVLPRNQPERAHPITANEDDTYDPTFLRDGKNTIAYKYQDEIWAMSLDGRHQRPLVVPGQTAPQLLPAGAEAYKPAAGQTADQISFTGRLRPTDSTGHTAQLRAANTDELFTYSLATHQLTQNTNNAVSDWFSSIDPRTNRMVFTSRQTPAGEDRIYTALPDATERHIIPGQSTLARDCSDPAFTPDGGGVVFVNNAGGTYDSIYFVSLRERSAPELLFRHIGATLLAPTLVPNLE